MIKPTTPYVKSNKPILCRVFKQLVIMNTIHNTLSKLQSTYKSYLFQTTHYNATHFKAWFPLFSMFSGIMERLLILMVIWFSLLALGGSGTTLMSYVIVLAVMIVPIVAFSTFKSRSNAKKFAQQDKALIERIKTILDNSEKLENTIILLNTNNRELESYLNQLDSTNREVTAALYKNSAYVKAARKSKALFKKDAYSEEENALASRINEVVDGLGKEVAVSQLLG